MDPVTALVTHGQMPPSPRFHGVELDEFPRLLTESYRLRYQVYCCERRFLDAARYPAKLETDAFDQHAVHLGVVDDWGTLLATARLVRRTEDGLPMFGHCSILRREPVLADVRAPLVEVSRLAVSRANLRQVEREDGEERRAVTLARRQNARAELITVLYRELYQASKRHGFTHWLVATEPSLQRLVKGFRFPFVQIGPLTDYFGPVAPYLMDLREFELEILSGEAPALHGFLDGLDASLVPVAHGR
jgi:N-acyl amino acid synthase of PEP-CTERM/exosortase system